MARAVSLAVARSRGRVKVQGGLCSREAGEGLLHICSYSRSLGFWGVSLRKAGEAGLCLCESFSVRKNVFNFTFFTALLLF